MLHARLSSLGSSRRNEEVNDLIESHTAFKLAIIITVGSQINKVQNSTLNFNINLPP